MLGGIFLSFFFFYNIEYKQDLCNLFANFITKVFSNSLSIYISLKSITSKCCMKIDNEKFIDVGKIVEYYGEVVILKLPHIHSDRLRYYAFFTWRRKN